MSESEVLLEKIRQLPRDIQIYKMQGHGEDLCDETGEAIIHRVPNGCLYITIEECGNIAFTEAIRDTAFHSTDPTLKVKFKYPYLFLPELNDIIKPSTRYARTYPNVIKIHFPGDNYVCNQMYPFGYWYDTHGREQHVGFAESGLVSKARAEMFQARNYPNGAFITTTHSDTVILPINKEHIIQYFQASVYPTPEEVREVLDNFRLDGVRYFDRGSYIPRSRREGADICKAIEREIEEKLGWYKGISDKDGPDAFMTNTYMMEKFPGIHYNFICRSMDPDCERKRGVADIRRRRGSINENRPRRILLDTPAVSDAIINHIVGDLTLDDRTLAVIESKRSANNNI